MNQGIIEFIVEEVDKVIKESDEQCMRYRAYQAKWFGVDSITVIVAPHMIYSDDKRVISIIGTSAIVTDVAARIAKKVGWRIKHNKSKWFGHREIVMTRIA